MSFAGTGANVNNVEETMINEKFHYQGDFRLKATIAGRDDVHVETVEGNLSRFTLERDSEGNVVRLEAEFSKRSQPFVR